MWSLTIPQAAATLAATTVAYNTLDNNGIRLLSESMLDVIIILIIIITLVGPMMTTRFGRHMTSELTQN